MKCCDVMSASVRACHEDDPVERCAKWMRSWEIGFLPVLDDKGLLIGVVTDRDLAMRVLAERRKPSTPIGEVMTREPMVTVGADDDLSIAESRMARFQKSRLPIVDEHLRCVGVISLSDVAQVEGLGAGRVLRAISRREVLVASE